MPLTKSNLPLLPVLPLHHDDQPETRMTRIMIMAASASAADQVTYTPRRARGPRLLLILAPVLQVHVASGVAL